MLPATGLPMERRPAPPALYGLTYTWNTTPVQTAAVGHRAARRQLHRDRYGCARLLHHIEHHRESNRSHLHHEHHTHQRNMRWQWERRRLGERVRRHAPYSYSWSNGATTAWITVGAGAYSVNVTDANGCAPATASAIVTAAAQPNSADGGSRTKRCAWATTRSL